MNSEIDLYVSSVTGNTQKIIDSLLPEMNRMGYIPRFPQNVAAADRGAGGIVISSDDCGAGGNFSLRRTVILGFWCRKGSMDPLSLRTLETLRDCRILAFGTMGFYPDSEYGDGVRARVTEAIEGTEGCTCLGVFLCQGRIPEERTEKRRALPKTAPHYLDDEGYARHLESRKHPDDRDLEDARKFLREHLPMDD